MTTIKQTKTKTYINHNGQLFMTNNDWTNRVITPANIELMNEQQVASLQYGFEEIGEFHSIDAAYSAYIKILNERKAERKVANDIMKQKIADRKAAEWNSIKDLPVIPTTLDNIRIVLEHLNEDNWGGWSLPKMSIGYCAHQYDCDGVQSSTMTLDTPVDGTYKFKVGGRGGHLKKYRSL